MNPQLSQKTYQSSDPHQTFKQETSKSWNKFKTRMLTQYFFATIFMISYPLLRGNQIGYLLPLTTLVNIFTRIKQELTFIKTSYRKTYSNLTLQ